jgi:hypothetical protein
VLIKRNAFFYISLTVKIITGFLVLYPDVVAKEEKITRTIAPQQEK